MAFIRFRVAMALFGLLTCASLACAQMAPETAEKLKAMGRVVNPPATAPLYAPRVLDREPFSGVKVERDIRYGGDERHLLDVLAPEAPSATLRPVFVFVHGGGFTRGDRRSPPGAPFYDNLMLWAVRNGMVGVNLTYRLAPKDLWPAGAQDLGLAMRWVAAQIAARGGDPEKVYMMGHSAGAAHVASYVADPSLYPASGNGLAGALILSGIFRITPELVAAEEPVRLYFGSDTARYAAQSAEAGLLRTQVPLWIAYAELDPPSFEAQSEGLKKALCEVGRCPAFTRFAGHSHMSEIYSIHTDDRQVGDAMLAFIRAH